jgi:hypothetical protein
MNYQIAFDEQEIPAFMVEQLAICLPCNDNETVASFENDSEIDISFSSRGSEFSYLSSGTSPMARALERVGNEVAVSQQQQQPRQRRQQRNQSKKSRRKQARSQQPQPAPSTQACRFFRSKKGCARTDCPFVHC